MDFSQTLIVRTAPTLAKTLAQYPQAMGLAIADIVHAPAVLPPTAQAVILTSQNAVPAASLALQGKKLPIYAVGRATAESAQALGMEVAEIGQNDAADLAACIVNAYLQPCVLAHFHGDTADLTWHGVLQKRGFSVTPVLAYRTQWLDNLPADTLAALHMGKLTTVGLWSARAAGHLQLLLKQARISPQSLHAVCCSAKVATVVCGFAGAHIAHSPTAAAMHTAMVQALPMKGQ
ncbi:MAG: uroporphyrinogen-III synthase [Alphaproteobacteria bacterium]